MLELFVSETCPYSLKVLTFFKEKEIKFKKMDINSQENFMQLMELGGKNQVPFLYDKDNNFRLYESDEIIKYVENLNK